MHENLRPDPLGDLQRSPDPVAGGEEPAALYPRTLPPLSASWASDFGLSPLTRNRKIGTSQHDGLGPCMFFFGGKRAMPSNYIGHLAPPECKKTFWRPGSARTPLGGAYSAPRYPITEGASCPSLSHNNPTPAVGPLGLLLGPSPSSLRK